MIQYSKTPPGKSVILLILFLTTTTYGFLQEIRESDIRATRKIEQRISTDRRQEYVQNIPIRKAETERERDSERLYDRRSFRTGSIDRNSENIRVFDRQQRLDRELPNDTNRASRDVRTEVRDVNNSRRDIYRTSAENRLNIRERSREDIRSFRTARQNSEESNNVRNIESLRGTNQRDTARNLVENRVNIRRESNNRRSRVATEDISRRSFGATRLQHPEERTNIIIKRYSRNVENSPQMRNTYTRSVSVQTEHRDKNLGSQERFQERRDFENSLRQRNVDQRQQMREPSGNIRIATRSVSVQTNDNDTERRNSRVLRSRQIRETRLVRSFNDQERRNSERRQDRDIPDTEQSRREELRLQPFNYQKQEATRRTNTRNVDIRSVRNTEASARQEQIVSVESKERRCLADREMRSVERRNVDQLRSVERSNILSRRDQSRSSDSREIRHLDNRQRRSLSERDVVQSRLPSRNSADRREKRQLRQDQSRRLSDSQEIRHLDNRDRRSLLERNSAQRRLSTGNSGELREELQSRQDQTRSIADSRETRHLENRERISHLERNPAQSRLSTRNSGELREELQSRQNQNRRSSDSRGARYLETREHKLVKARSLVQDRLAVRAFVRDTRQRVQSAESRERVSLERRNLEQSRLDDRRSARRNTGDQERGTFEKRTSDRIPLTDQQRTSDRRQERVSGDDYLNRRQNTERREFENRFGADQSRSDSTRKIRDQAYTRKETQEHRQSPARITDQRRSMSMPKNEPTRQSERSTPLTADSRRNVENLVSVRKTRDADRTLAGFDSIKNVDYIPIKVDSNAWVNTAKILLVAFLIGKILVSSSKGNKIGFSSMLSMATSIKEKVQ